MFGRDGRNTVIERGPTLARRISVTMCGGVVLSKNLATERLFIGSCYLRYCALSIALVLPSLVSSEKIQRYVGDAELTDGLREGDVNGLG